ERGRDGEPGVLGNSMRYACSHVRQGRSLGRDVARAGRHKGESRHDVFDRPGMAIGAIDLDLFAGDRASVPHRVAFKVDVAAFLAGMTARQREIALSLASGATTTETARAHGVTLGAISQHRTRFKAMFDQFYASAV